MHLHLIRGDTAGYTLRSLLKKIGEEMSVIVINDMPAYGPLTSDICRDAWWREISSLDEVYAPRLYRRWCAVHRLFAKAKPDRLVVWTSEETDDHIFLRMVCDQLRGFQGNIELVEAPPWGPPDEQWHGLGMYGPDDLAGFLSSSRQLPSSERASLADDWARIPQGGGVRIRSSEGISLRGYDIWDDTLLSHVGVEWQTPLLMIGRTMGHHTNLTGLSDRFLLWRVSELVKVGFLEIVAPAESRQPDHHSWMREARVRRPA